MNKKHTLRDDQQARRSLGTNTGELSRAEPSRARRVPRPPLALDPPCPGRHNNKMAAPDPLRPLKLSIRVYGSDSYMRAAQDSSLGCLKMKFLQDTHMTQHL